MSIKSLIVAASMVGAGTTGAADSPLSTDRMVRAVDGSTHIVRASDWTDFNGRTVSVEQRLTLDQSGHLIYRYDAQTTATQLYHQAFCESMNMTPSRGDGIVRGPATGWACTGTDDPEEPPAGARSADWVIAAAPTGRVPVGTTYTSTSLMRMESSVGGQRSGVIGVDNGRCSYTDITHYGGPFRDSTGLAVACVVHEPRSVSTSMDVCIPKQCHNDRGTQFAE